MKKINLTVTALGLVALLAGCGDVSEALGLGRHPPDEFAVVDRPPLALPPDYTLHPPKPGASRPQEINQTQKASMVLFGADAKIPNTSSANDTNNVHSDAEKSILESAGASHAEPNIRAVIDRESTQKIVGTTHLVDELLWWRKDKTNDTVVDASAESKRITQDKAKGEPLNQGKTPIIEREKSGWLGL